MKNIFIAACISTLLLLSGCRERQLSINIEIPKEVAITKELRKIRELEAENKKSADASTASINPAVFLPIVQKILSDVLKSTDKKDKIVYQVVVFDNDTIEGEYSLKVEDMSIDIKIKKEKQK